MKINGLVPGIGSPATSGMVDQIMQIEKAPVEAAKLRREKVVGERNEYKSLSGMIDGLGSALDGLRSPQSFRKLRLESSHPDIINGVVDGAAELGNYAFEVRDLAKADKHLAFGFGDVDKTAVGFGYMAIEGADGKAHEIVIDPGATLKDVASKINESASGVKASIINTGIGDEPYRLMVASEKTGEAARVSIDPDTTFLDFKEQVKGTNLDLRFEDVEVSRPTNSLSDLLSGVKLDAKRAEPGTRVQVNVTHDVDATLTGIKAFTEKYNQIAGYATSQTQLDPSTKRANGVLASDSSLRSIMRSLQSNVSSGSIGGGRFRSLADVGITTNPKNGSLNLDETKLKAALAEDYEGVAKIFARTESGPGIAERLSQAVKNLQNSQSGVLNTRTRSLDKIIKQQDQAIERQTQRMTQREAQLKGQFDKLQSKMVMLQGQQDFMAARFGGPTPANGGGDNQ